jgi:LPXTG-motif cell wall-anchored protein
VAGTNVAVAPVADPGAGSGGAQPQVQGATDGTLPRTGAPLAGEVAGGLLLLGGGLVLLAIRRRRSSPDMT